jgi:hypothetical protein
MKIYNVSFKTTIRILVILIAVIPVCCLVNTKPFALNQKSLLRQMFSEKIFIKQSTIYNAGYRDSYYIENIIPGSFVEKYSDEFFVIVRRPSEELSHTQGFYNAYAAVFNKSGKIISSVKLFWADEGQFYIYRSTGRDYILFLGNSTHQGWTEWRGDLWTYNNCWKSVWPDVKTQDEYYAFWENTSAEAQRNGLRMYSKKIKPDSKKIIPDCNWEFSYYLNWNKESAVFIRQPD